ncbi:MAG: MFS transporter [Oscillospiraceae bacterium]|nr:MFS transporter [Oscillospiraceae bacterium]MDY3937510.1 MFS transporter [Oscillospiraceae bacterium]
MADKAKKVKLNYGKTALIGFGFMAVQIAWIIYNAYVPLILKENSTIANLSWASTAVGIIMVIDNVFGVVFQPLFGKISDRTHTRFGKRTPFLMIGIPVCALLFIFIPRIQLLGVLMLDIIVFNFIMSTWRSPVVAMMPDFVPSELRGEGNAVINIMGGVGVVLGTVAGKIITGISGNNETQFVRNNVFLFGAIVMVVCLLVVVFLVREPDNRITKAESLKIAADYKKAKGGKEKKASIKSLGLTKGEKKSLIFMLIALFFNSNATDSINTYFTTFAKYELNFKESDASLIITLFAAATVIGAIPAGKLGQKFGRKKTIMSGWIGVLVLFLLYAVTQWFWLLYVAIVAGGILIAFVTINTLPLVLEIGGIDRVGTFTGYYYTATFSASIVGPVLVGTMFDMTKVFSSTGEINYWSLFFYCPVCFALALLCMSQVKHGETRTISDDVIKEAQQDD